jgi:hypothetical protein
MLKYNQIAEGNCTLEITAIGAWLLVRELRPYYCPYCQLKIKSSCADHVNTLYPQRLALTSPTTGGLSVGIFRLRTKATEFSF